MKNAPTGAFFILGWAPTYNGILHCTNIAMPLSAPKVSRQPLHHRTIHARGYLREDGLYDIEGHLTDVKELDFTVASGPRKAGDTIHSMWLRITVDRALHIVDAEASTDAMPYEGYCDRITPDYKKLIGLAIRPGFNNRIKTLLSGTAGCTHLTELIGTLATTAFQTMAGQGHQPADKQPYQLDRCHALALAAPAVARFYPKWYKGTEPITGATDSENH
jgi:hypothetical protein